MKLPPRIVGHCLASLCISLATFSIARADIIFDSLTLPLTQNGFSSENGGLAIQLDVTSDITVTGISVINQMLEPGNLRFLIYSEPDHALLLLTPPKSFAADQPGAQPWIPGTPTWKDSDPIYFTLKAGNKYDIGYVHDVGVNEAGDSVSESNNGITSELVTHCVSGFQSPTYSHSCITGVEFGVRIQAVPEASTPVLFFLGLAALALTHHTRKRREATTHELATDECSLSAE